MSAHGRLAPSAQCHLLDYTPSTIEYHGELNAFEVARAEIYSGWHAHRLSLIVVATPGELGADRAAIEETIARSRGTHPANPLRWRPP
jgi:hypothetical protein